MFKTIFNSIDGFMLILGGIFGEGVAAGKLESTVSLCRTPDSDPSTFRRLLRLQAGALGLIEFLKQFSSRLVDLC